MNINRIHAALIISGEDGGVERPAAGAAPTAFRIWRAGSNPTSKGPTVFTKKSAAWLLADQAVRGTLYSIDVDHMSLSDDAPPEHHRAVGWHQLEARETPNGPELWAVNVEWTPAIKAALESDPPGFRYFSPAYDVARETGEVVGYLNTALTNNPATFQVTALATRAAQGAETMGMKECIAALTAVAEGEDEAEAKKAKAALAALEASDDEKKPAPAEEEKKDSEGSEDEEKKDPPMVEDKKDSIAATAANVVTLDPKKVEEIVDAKLRRIADDNERARLIASRTDVPQKVRDALTTKPLALVRELLDAIPVTARKNPAADISVAATRGKGQGEGASSRLPPEEKAALDERMGIVPRKASIRREGNEVVFGVLTNAAAQQILASKEGK